MEKFVFMIGTLTAAASVGEAMIESGATTGKSIITAVTVGLMIVAAAILGYCQGRKDGASEENGGE